MQHVPNFQGSPPRRCFVVEREKFHHLEIDSEDFPSEGISEGIQNVPSDHSEGIQSSE